MDSSKAGFLLAVGAIVVAAALLAVSSQIGSFLATLTLDVLAGAAILGASIHLGLSQLKIYSGATGIKTPIPVSVDGQALTRCIQLWRDPAYTSALEELGWVRPSDLTVFCKDLLAEYEALPRDRRGAVTVVDENAVSVENYRLFQDIENLDFDELLARNLVPSHLRRAGLGDVGSDCKCWWVYHHDFYPAYAHEQPDLHAQMGWTTDGVSYGFGEGPMHSMEDQWKGNCFAESSSHTSILGAAILYSKVICRPAGCCTPGGKTVVLSDYLSFLAVDSKASWCLPAFDARANASASDACQLVINGAVEPSGAGAKVLISGAGGASAANLSVGGSHTPGPTGASAGGAVSVELSSVTTKAHGLIEDSFPIRGAKTLDEIAVISELQTGGSTSASIHGKATATAAIFERCTGMAHVANEKQCGAGPFKFAYCHPNSITEDGLVERASFLKRVEIYAEFLK